MNRRRMLNALTTAQEIGDYEDAAVIPAETDPQIHLSRNRLPQPFHLICEKDTVLSALAGSAHVYLRDSSVNRFRMGIGDHVYVPARTPHRLVPIEEVVTLRFTALNAGSQGAAWYCPACDAEVQRYEWEHDNNVPAVAMYAAACARFTADEAARTCATCGAVHPGIDLVAFGWSLPVAA